MSIHKSLKMKNALVRQRNVLTRAERIEILMKSGAWNEGDSAMGLPKVRGRIKMKKKPKVKEEVPAGAETEEKKEEE